MKVIFNTNIDAYKTNCFPMNLNQAPRKEDFVMVDNAFFEHYRNKKLPIRLVVVSVTWTNDAVICELHYNKQDIEIARMNGANLF